MSFILRLLLAEKRILPEILPHLACCNLSFNTECLPYQQLYYKYLWQKNINLSHLIIQKAAQVIMCVSTGQRTFSSICTRPDDYHYSFDDHSTQIKLETIIQYSLTMNREYIDELCDSYREGPEMIADPWCASQHTDFGWLSWSLNNIKSDAKWFNTNGLMTDSDTCELCSCYHCKAYGDSPNDCCECLKCSDPVTGDSYWSKLSWPE